MEALNSITRQVAVSVLDACWAQHKLLASNIANQSSPDYRARSIDFDAFLGHLGKSLPTSDSASSGLLRTDLTPFVQTSNAPIQLDAQMGDLAANTLRYDAILTVLSRLQSMNRSAVEGGAR